MTSAQTATGFRVGLVQMCSGRDVERNVADATALIREAAKGGAQYVQTPEATTLMELERERLFKAALPEAAPALRHFQGLAAELQIWLHVGSMAMRASPERIANRSILISPSGTISARYDKIHMFDVDLPGGESYRESASYEAGRHAVVADLPWGPLGLTICYDLRFPQLHRALARAGAKFLAVPSAFTRLTGEAHWHTLLRARAIESQCYVFAAAQGGRHEHGRETYGHSLVVSPWGQILAEGGVHPSVIYADVELGAIEDVRTRVPSLEHDRAFDVVYAGTKPP
ncbi:MAG TPA: carbon-nitrogen hydrolase family protein [Hyphomicrobiaceae bacterium]|nr:carbon-nitrogen hydrolase family protein [Hyphomicrobiaceae bacterium]